ncbi:hypothetical protein VHEMI01183 [[Torrubiella] hemipterigena]|uniref:DUF7605 domain-containing protein n=1 Tax=[Torrubiella] hemipterigena TaxID=1531966 RepID=A0A0A1SSE2_9HYPO|nr:hypothetical protein VHEMI01183 [[Torrubiella] hemipterigena]
MGQLSDLLQSYRQFQSRSYDESSEAARQDCENRAKMAADTFQAMFGERLENDAFLVEHTPEDILQTFQTWINEIRPVRLLNRMEIGTLEECSNALVHLASDKTAGKEPPVWPYLRKIKVYCNAQILSKGLILADLPGLGDLNSARRNVTERFLRECHEIFVVCNIGRAVTDIGVEDVFKLAMQAKQENLRNVGIVCTRSDEIKPDEARNDWTGPTVERIRQLQREIERKKRELRRIKDQLDDLDSEDERNSEEISRHKDQKKLTKITMKQREFELLEFLITTRSEDVIEKLTAHYEEFIPENNLQVYCISNDFYWDNRDADREESQPYLNLSGIIQLRKRCISIVSNAQHEAATSFMQNDIPALIANVGLWVESGAATMDDERKESIRRVCGVLEQQLVGAFQSGSAPAVRLSRTLQQQFTDNIWSTRNTAQWADGAKDMASVWHGWHHATYAAYCRHFGHYCSGVQPGRNWNEQIIHRMVNDLSTPWESVHNSANGEYDNLSLSVNILLDDLIEYLETELGVAANEVVLLRRVLQTERSILLNEISQAFRTFNTDLFQLRVNTLSGIRTSFVGSAMEGSYRACQNEGGTGSDRRRKAIIEGAVTNRQLFTGIIRESRAGFIALAEAVGIATASSMDDYVAKVGRSLNIIRDQNVASESGRDPAFRRRVEEAVGIAQDIMSGVEDRIRA